MRTRRSGALTRRRRRQLENIIATHAAWIITRKLAFELCPCDLCMRAFAELRAGA